MTPLIEVTGGDSSPNTLITASASAASLSGVEVPWALIWRMSAASRPASSSASFMHTIAPDPPGDGAMMVGVGIACRAHDLPEDRRTTSCRVLPLLEDEHGGALTHHEPVAADVERTETPDVERAVMLPKPASDVTVAAASAPPVTTASQRPQAISRAAFPMAWVPAAHAVQIVSLGPCRP